MMQRTTLLSIICLVLPAFVLSTLARNFEASIERRRTAYSQSTETINTPAYPQNIRRRYLQGTFGVLNDEESSIFGVVNEESSTFGVVNEEESQSFGVANEDLTSTTFGVVVNEESSQSGQDSEATNNAPYNGPGLAFAFGSPGHDEQPGPINNNTTETQSNGDDAQGDSMLEGSGEGQDHYQNETAPGEESEDPLTSGQKEDYNSIIDPNEISGELGKYKDLVDPSQISGLDPSQISGLDISGSDVPEQSVIEDCQRGHVDDCINGLDLDKEQINQISATYNQYQDKINNDRLSQIMQALTAGNQQNEVEESSPADGSSSSFEIHGEIQNNQTQANYVHDNGLDSANNNDTTPNNNSSSNSTVARQQSETPGIYFEHKTPFIAAIVILVFGNILLFVHVIFTSKQLKGLKERSNAREAETKEEPNKKQTTVV